MNQARYLIALLLFANTCQATGEAGATPRTIDAVLAKVIQQHVYSDHFEAEFQRSLGFSLILDPAQPARTLVGGPFALEDGTVIEHVRLYMAPRSSLTSSNMDMVLSPSTCVDAKKLAHKYRVSDVSGPYVPGPGPVGAMANSAEVHGSYERDLESGRVVLGFQQVVGPTVGSTCLTDIILK